jgi:hypothetical protein
MFKKVSVLLLIVAFLFGAVAPVQASAATSMSRLYVVHGINGVDLGLGSALPVDVYVEGVGCALKGFTFRQVAGPLSLPAGSYNISIKLANAAAPCTGATAIGPAAFNLMGGKTNTIVAHLTASGAPSATMFENKVSRPAPGMTRISLAHAAFAPAVDAKISRLFGTTVTVPNVINGQQASLDTRAGIYSASLNLAGTSTRVFGPAYFLGLPSVGTFGYVVGSAANGLYLVKINIWTR